MKKLLIVDDDVAVTNYLMVFLMQTASMNRRRQRPRSVPTILSESSST